MALPTPDGFDSDKTKESSNLSNSSKTSSSSSSANSDDEVVKQYKESVRESTTNSRRSSSSSGSASSSKPLSSESADEKAVSMLKNQKNQQQTSENRFGATNPRRQLGSQMADESNVFSVGNEEPLSPAEAKAQAELREKFQKLPGVTQNDTRYLEYEKTPTGYSARLPDSRAEVVEERLVDQQAEEDRRLQRKLSIPTEEDQSRRSINTYQVPQLRYQPDGNGEQEVGTIDWGQATEDPIAFLRGAGKERERKLLNPINKKLEDVTNVDLPSSEQEFSNIVVQSASENKESIATAAAVGVVAPEPVSSVGGAVTLGGLTVLGLGADYAINQNNPEVEVPDQSGQSQSEFEVITEPGTTTQSELPVDGGAQNQVNELDIQQTVEISEISVPEQNEGDLGTLSTAPATQQLLQRKRQAEEEQISDDESQLEVEIVDSINREQGVNPSQDPTFNEGPSEIEVTIVDSIGSQYEYVDWEPFDIVGYTGAGAAESLGPEIEDATSQTINQANLQGPSVKTPVIGATRQETQIQPDSQTQTIFGFAQPQREITAQAQDIGSIQIGDLAQPQLNSFEYSIETTTENANPTATPVENLFEDEYNYPNPNEAASGRGVDRLDIMDFGDSSQSKKRKESGELVGEYFFNFRNPLTGSVDETQPNTPTQAFFGGLFD